MIKLLKKEFLLACHPMMIVFSFFTVMLLIPNYPPIVGFIYVLVSFTFLFPLCFENKDYYYTALLPIHKKDVVKAKFLTVISIEILSLLIAIPCALIYHFAYPSSLVNDSFFVINFVTFAIGFIMYALFNAFFFLLHFKSQLKVLIPMLVSMVASSIVGLILLLICCIEPFHIKQFLAEHIYVQLLLLFISILLYALVNYVSLKKCCIYFEKIDIK